MKRTTALWAALACTAALAQGAPKNDEARLLRFPSVGGDQIAFTYAGDLYTVSIDGGEAKRLTSDIGYEMFSRFSPDGKTIAFTAQYDGNTEVYTIPVEGGAPQRVTYTALVDRDNIGDRMGPNNIVMCWTPDGKIVFRTKWYTFSGLRGQLYTVNPDGSKMTQIPTTEGGFCSFSPDGKKLAMNRMFREFRTWKYYRGGQADDIWINKVGTTELKNITNNDAQDIFPMWVGNEIYFLSDRDSIMNVFCYDTKTEKIAKVTDFKEYDCKFPSYSKDYIVFENGGYIYKLSTKDKSCEQVHVSLKAEGIYARSEWLGRAEGNALRPTSLSPDGQRVLATMRGDIFSLPAEEGATYNLFPSSGSQEREPRWSPDGSQIAYISDASGEYQVYVMDSQDPSKKTCLTSFKDGYPQSLSWSPDSKTLYFTMEKLDAYALDVATKSLKQIFKGDYSGMRGYEISRDGKYIAYSTEGSNGMSVVCIYDIAAGKHHTVTTPWYSSSSPVFSEDGKYLFFTSQREFQSHYSRVEWNAAYDVQSSIFVLPLTKEAANPTIMKGNEYGQASAKPEPKGKGDGEKKEVKGVSIDFDGIVERATALPLPAGMYMLIAGFGDDLYYSSMGEMKKYSLKTNSSSPASKARVIALSGDKKKAVISEGGKTYVSAAPAFSAGKKAVPTTEASVYVDYHAEWEQIFNETWRVYRDGFYVKNMVGKDWNKIHDKYAALLPYVNHRQDLTYIIGEMIAELATGHCYVTTGQVKSPKRVATGLLGAKFSKDDKSGAFRIDHIFKGAEWDVNVASPLAAQGLGVKEGDFILSVNGQDCKDMVSIYQALIGKVGATVALKVNSKPSADGAKTIYVKPIASESKLAYYEWVKGNIEKVEKMSNGEIGYIHIPDMSTEGLDMFTKLFYNQLDKKALIIDDRMNGGGNVSPMIIERLQREAYRLNMYRNGGKQTHTVPQQTFHGPKVCLVDKYSSSDGDLFPYGFQKIGLGPIIGMRTWGGIVGISGSKPYVDGQDVRTPFFTSYSIEGEWIVENHGVDPDIVVDINPFEDFKGTDAQLNKAVEYLQKQLKSYKALPGVPADPVR